MKYKGMGRFSHKDTGIIVSIDETHMENMEQLFTVSKVDIVSDRFYAFLDETGDENIIGDHKMFAYSGICFTGDFDTQQFYSEWSYIKKSLFKVKDNSEFHTTRHLRRSNNKASVILEVSTAIKKFPLFFVSAAVLESTIVDGTKTDKDRSIVESLLGGISHQATSLIDRSVDLDEWYIEDSYRVNPIVMTCMQPEYYRSRSRGAVRFIKSDHACHSWKSQI